MADRQRALPPNWIVVRERACGTAFASQDRDNKVYRRRRFTEKVEVCAETFYLANTRFALTLRAHLPADFPRVYP